MRKLIGLIICGVATFFIVFMAFAVTGNDITTNIGNISNQNVSTETYTVWYTNKSLINYLDKVLSRYFSETGIKVEAKYIETVDLVEDINAENINGTGPDLLITGSESLEKIYLAGLTRENTDLKTYSLDNYSEAALNAVTYHGKMIAYPMFNTTSVLVCNNEYSESVPKNFDEIVEFAKNFETGDDAKVKSILKWNAAGLMSSYAFAGEYLNYGGPCGDNDSIIDLNSEKAKTAFEYYVNLQSYFYLNANKIKSIDIYNDFVSGECIYAIIETDYLRTLINAGLDFTTATIPSLNDEYATTPLSSTRVVVVNPYTKNPQAAEKIAKYLTYDIAIDIFEGAGYLPCREYKEYTNPAIEVAMESYAKSKTLPKLRNASDYWIQLENTYKRIWKGKDIGKQLDSLQEYMESKRVSQ